MPTKNVVIRFAEGLHARPAAALAAVVARSGAPVTIGRLGQAGGVDAASMLSVMGLGLGHGETVTLTSSGPDTEQLLDELADLLDAAR
jgi:phosphotransferase system HPr (HPr) family protein